LCTPEADVTEPTRIHDELLDAWRYARGGFIAEAENIPASDWSFRPTPENRDVPELVRHVIQSSLMGVGELVRADGDFTRQGFQAHVQEHAGHLPESAGREEWLRLLRDTLEEGISRLRELGPDGILRPIRQFNGEPATRLTWFHHNIAHEDYHRGQLALYGRLTGHVPALTRQIRGG
jgi:uncharacterized damage-inducible protein DinB